ncbi:flagellar hook-length control protein FliK [Variovorax sp. JS1663]|uniref:flagellar hook-length control protein FliK n=1 Tax=Variovorax sp. JS1663 TaxID=1851577 RepID=UPI000B342F78|nr:flagellar hook-length control protein FliK [Variovorax sp. JS1663]OUL99231.1 hypothetical protein A8M77_27285 [Variovorax sp. JS1663]
MNKLGTAPDHALLAAKLAPRLELVALQQGQVATDAAPGPVAEVQKVANDVRLPSHISLERQLPAALPGAAPAADPSAPAAARLSPAARLIGALLAELPDAGPLRSTVPLWPSARQPASGAALAGALAQTVDRSGLFYESHLAEFAAGARTLAQMAQEPQARWAPPLPARGDAAAPAAATTAAAAPVPGAAATTPEAVRPVAPVAMLSPAPLPMAADASAPVIAAGALPAAPRPAEPGPGIAAPHAFPPAEPGGSAPAADAERVRAAYRAGEGAPAASAGTERIRMEIESARQHAASVSPSASVVPTQAGEMIHPQTATVVHQQLDLLATAVFRWSGHAWPEVPMHWSIQEDDARPQDGGDGHEAQPRRWSTTVSLDLPRLGTVEMRLSLGGAVVQAQLVVSQATTAGRLRAQGGALERRFDAAGLRLEGLRVSERETP